MTPNRINRSDRVKVTVTDESRSDQFTYEGTGFHNVAQAIAAAYSRMTGVEMPENEGYDESLEQEPSFFHYYRNPDAGANDIENYTFTVFDETTGVTSRYRVNAGGHVHLIA